MDPEQVRYCICTHLDSDHRGGIDDFNNLEIHVSREEYEAYSCAKDQRHLSHQLSIHENVSEHCRITLTDKWLSQPLAIWEHELCVCLECGTQSRNPQHLANPVSKGTINVKQVISFVDKDTILIESYDQEGDKPETKTVDYNSSGTNNCLTIKPIVSQNCVKRPANTCPTKYR